MRKPTGHGDERLSRIELSPLPFRIGRRPGLDLTLPHTSVSREHAEFYLDRDGLRALHDVDPVHGLVRPVTAYTYNLLGFKVRNRVKV